MGLGKKIIKLRELKGLSQSQFINLLKNELDISEHEKLQGAISNLERRDSKNSKYTAIMAKVLNVSIDDLLNDKPPELFAYKEINKKNTIAQCPLISWVQAGAFCAPEVIASFENADEWRYCPVKHSDQTYVLTIKSNSMEPLYLEGTEIFVDPTLNPQHNDDVVVSDPQGRATFKRLKITHEGRYLEALNPSFPERIIKVPEGSIICGVVIYAGWKPKRKTF
jgi:SOS-response transcriptional repressor LexA